MPALPGAYTFNGPDLTFIEIPIGPRLQTFQSLGTFWSLDKNPDVLLARYSHEGVGIVNTGFPEVDQRRVFVANNIYSKAKFMVFIGALANGDVTNAAPWDYIDSTCNYSAIPDLPSSFEGISGGGIWSYQMQVRERDNVWTLRDYCLIGVNFWETSLVNQRRTVRGHFIRSIYDDLAWTAAGL